MNTNNNIYTVVYTTVICVLVAAILAFVSQALGPKQAENMKAETIGQILKAAQFEQTTIDTYKSNIEKAVVINAEGQVVRELDCQDAEVYKTSQLKVQNKSILNAAEFEVPVYIFSNGVSVIPVYGAGLWGPVWGYVALENGVTIKGVVFDHESETPGLGGKIKDDPKFAEQFKGKSINYAADAAKPFAIVKGGAPAGDNSAVDAISGATMTSKGLGEALNAWFAAYKAYFCAAAPAACPEEVAEKCCEECQNTEN